MGCLSKPSAPPPPPRQPTLNAARATQTLRDNPAFQLSFQTVVAEQVHDHVDLNEALLQAWHSAQPPQHTPAPASTPHTVPHPRLDRDTRVTLRQFWDAKRAVRQALDLLDSYTGPPILYIADGGMQAVRRSFPRSMQGLRRWMHAWQSATRFHQIDRRMRRTCRAKKLQQLDNLLAEAQNSPEQGILGLYRIIHRFKPKTSKRTIHFRDSEGKLMTAQAELAQLREYFSDLFQESTRAQAPDWHLHDGLWPSLGEVTAALHSLPTSKALPSGHAPAALWRQNVASLAPVVTQQLQEALGPGQLRFPEQWHLSYMVLLPKEGKPPTAPQHLRPICLLPAMSKIIARILAGRLRPYLEQALDRIPQFAYLRSRQTSDALDRVLSHCQSIRQQLGSYRNSLFDKRAGVQHRHFCGGLQVSLDLSKAFDRTPRARLYQALLRIGAPSDLASAIMYVHDHAKIVLERHELFETVPLVSGIRQGCGLSPLLWLAFTLLLYEELLPICPQDAITCFADDFHLHWTLTTSRDFRNACQHIIQIFEVFEQHGMTIATDKTVVLLAMKGPEVPGLLQEFVRRQGPDRWLILPRASGNLLIPIRTSHKYLGVHIGYGKFERTTLNARLRLSWIAFGRLHTFLKHPGLPVARRLSLWRTYIWAILQYGLTAVGLDEWSADKLRSQVAKQVRLVARSPAHVLRETTNQLYARLGMQDPVITLATTCQHRIDTSRRMLDHLQPTRVKQWWNLLGSTFSTLSPQTPSALDGGPSRLREVTTVASFKCACPECGQYFPTSHALSVHIGKQHAGTRPSKARSTREKQVRCEEYRQHSANGMPQCRHCHRKFYGWPQFRGHFSQRSCPVLHYHVHAADKTPQLAPADLTMTAPHTSTAEHAGALPAYGALAPGEDSQASTQLPDMPLFDRPALQQLAKRSSVQALAAAIRSSGTLQHCPVCFQWIAKTSYVARHACIMHADVAEAQSRVLKWAQSKPPPLCPCNWCGARFRGPAATHRKSCVVIWMCGHFLNRFDSLEDPGQTTLDGRRGSEDPGPQGCVGGTRTLCGIHEPVGSSHHGPEHGPGISGERGADRRPEHRVQPDGGGSREASCRTSAGTSSGQVAQGTLQRGPQGRGAGGDGRSGQGPGVRPNRQRSSPLSSQSLAAAFRAGADGAKRTARPTAETELVGSAAAPHERPSRSGLAPGLARPGTGPGAREGGLAGPGGGHGETDAPHRGQPQRLQPRHQLHAVSPNEGVREGLDGDQGAVCSGSGMASPEGRGCHSPQPTDEDSASALPPHRAEDPPPQHGIRHGNVSQGQGNGPDGWHALPVLEVESKRAPLRAGRAGAPGPREGYGDRGVFDPAHDVSRHDREVPSAAEAHSDDGKRGYPLLAPDSESHSGGTPNVLPDATAVPQWMSSPGGSHGQTHPFGSESPCTASGPDPADAPALKPTEAQVAGLILRNPSTHCYANSVVLALLWVAQHLPRGLHVQRNYSRLMRWLLRKPLHATLWHLRAWTVLMQGWTEPNRQHDAADYLHFLRPHLSPAASEGAWESRLEGPELDGPAAVQVADHGHVWPLHLSVVNASAHSASLQKLFIDWRNQAQRHALVSAPAALVVQVGRFKDNGEKLRFRLPSSRTVYIPVFRNRSDLQTTSLAYEVSAIVFHLGRSRDSGHYRAAFLQQGQLHWLTDDGVLPACIQASEAVEVETNSYLFFLTKRIESE